MLSRCRSPLLLLAIFAPAALGHLDSGVFPLADPNGVSGVYVGSAGYYASPTTYSALMTCDREVAGDGSSTLPADEALVDGSPGGLAVDSWNDGGHGGACHTNHYVHADYNTPGCPDQSAHALDVALTVTVWIGAACDWLTTVSPLGTSACPGSAPGAVVRCTSADPLVCAAVPCVAACGADGVVDDINFGYGGFGVPYPHPAWASDACASADAIAMVFVFDTPAGEATQGSIWTV